MSTTSLSALHAAIAAVCPIDGVAILNPVTHVVRIDFQPAATAPQRTAANNVVAAFDWTAGTQATRDAQAAKAGATAGIDLGQMQNGTIDQRLIRAQALVMLDEINLIRANFAAPMTPRTSVQLVNAIKAKIALTSE